MSWSAVATAGSAIIGGISSSQASDKASDAAKKSGQLVQAAADRARRDVLQLAPQAQQSLLTGAQGAFDILGQSIPEQQRQVSAGNVAAQQAQQRGLDNTTRALLGLPTLGFDAQAIPFANEPVEAQLTGTPQEFDLSGARTVLPTFQGLGNVQPLPTLAPPPTPQQQQRRPGESDAEFSERIAPGGRAIDEALGLGGINAGLSNQLGVFAPPSLSNPLGGGRSIAKKVFGF